VTVAIEPWLEAFRHIARHYRLPLSEQSARLASLWSGEQDEREAIRALARSVGLRIRFEAPDAAVLNSWRLPLIVRSGDGTLAVVTAIGGDGRASIVAAGDEGLESIVALDALIANADMLVVPRPAGRVPDSRVDTYIRPYEEHWLRRIVLRDARAYGHVLVASLVANCLALAGVLFSMQVYDRVIPAASYPTLFILFGGVLLAIGFDFVLRRLRMRIIDILGKRADLRMSDLVFGHALRVRNRARPSSTGTFIAQLRDLEQVRELLTSTTVSAMVDIPFFLLFLAIFWFIGGILALVPLTALALLVLPGLLAQRRLRAYANESMRESSLRNAMLVEAVQGIEDIKTLQAENRFERQWNHFNAVAGEAQLKLRGLTNSLVAWTQNVQNGVFATVVFFGAPMVIAGELTTGALVAASILGSRMMAPMAQVTQVLSRLQQAKVGIRSLDQIMQLPVDNPEAESRIHAPAIAGGYALSGAVFRYGEEGAPAALAIRDLTIMPGERIAVLGRNGAGKSTLLQGLSGLLEPVSGEVLLDGMVLGQIDPADVRRDVGLLTQNSRLFHGTIRDNLTLGAPQASSEQIMAAIAMVGAEEMIRRSRAGLEHLVLEGGAGLSGGQVQALLLARLLVREPRVVLLDEPTASMDETTERHFISRFGAWSRGRTVVIATHRMRVLDLVDRLIVIDNGAVVLDDAKDAALRTMRGQGKAA